MAHREAAMRIGSSDLRACLEAVHAIASAGAGLDGFARAGSESLRRLLSCESTRLLIRKLPAFRTPGGDPGPLASPGPAHVMAVPIHEGEGTRVSFVFNRRRVFGERDRERVEVIRRHLGDLYRLARAVDDARSSWGVPRPAGIPSPKPALTARESEVLGWLAGGKTDRDIADILGISPRTVHKHLQRIYEKLGVETRTAAVVRAMQLPGAATRTSRQRPAGSGELPL